MRYSIFCLLLLVTVFATACLNRKENVSYVSRSNYRPNLAVTLTTSTDCPRKDEVLALRAEVKNTGTETEVVEAVDEPVLDIVIDNFPNDVYGKFSQLRWSDGKALSSDLTRLELKPGEARAIEVKVKNTATFSKLQVTSPLRFNYRGSNELVRPEVKFCCYC